MIHGTYIGPIEHLKGKTALLQVTTDECVVAQFDDRSLLYSTSEPFDFESPTIIPLPGDALGFRWHVFPQKDFLVSMRDALVVPTPLEDWQDPHAMPMRSDRSHLRGHS